MSTPNAPMTDQAPKSSSFWRRIAASILIGVIFFGVLWYTVFSAVTAALVGSGTTVVLFAGASWSDLFENILDTLANILLAILCAGAVATAQSPPRAAFALEEATIADLQARMTSGRESARSLCRALPRPCRGFGARTHTSRRAHGRSPHRCRASHRRRRARACRGRR